MSDVLNQVGLTPRSMKSRIAEAMVAELQTVRGIRKVTFDRVKLRYSDFIEDEIPIIQVIDLDGFVKHENVRALKTWNIAVELVLRSTDRGVVNQQDLWDMQYRVERALWRVPNLNIPGMIHFIYAGWSTDLHLIEPYYSVRMEVQAVFYDNLVREC